MSKKIRIGIVGAGQNTKSRHIPGLLAIDGVEIIAVCNRSEESTRAVATEFGIQKAVSKWPDLIQDRDIDAVVIGTWPYLHYPVTMAALAAEKHVLCEARMAMNSREAREMLRLARANPGLIAQVVPSPFTLSVDATIKDLIREGYFGELISVDVKALAADFPEKPETMHWRHNRELSGNNILSMGIWYEAVMRWIGEAKSVFAVAKSVVPFKFDQEIGDVKASSIPDHVDIIAAMACGSQLHMQLSGAAVADEPPSAVLYGTDATVKFTRDALYSQRRGEDGLSPIEIPKHKRQVWRVEEEFIQAIRGIEPVRLTTFADGLSYMEFTDAVHQSLGTGRVIGLPLR